ncbi:F5/8 type C domain containing protein [Tritrichomonas foetus]|uniref:F5/8 type C domain containing protein n=1 Tax=Tritrichomonas foetus TaxID=1144522 RepID=A0A1J4JZF3_9EUKA|nr:F5/8 type C domain containing protein [Tritrichomonas foetus]|eukprot:OHT02908.1 F5/8 type C domain containing protein [Tritrichomonas foetus]
MNRVVNFLVFEMTIKRKDILYTLLNVHLFNMIEEKQSSSPDEFSIIYNSTPITISKYKFALYSSKFRSIPNFQLSNSINVTGNAPISVFNEFIKAAQGESININDDTIFDLLTLCEEWETPTITQIITQYLKERADYNQICEKYTQLQNDNILSNELTDFLASNLNAVINLPSFQNYPLNTVVRILSSTNLVVDVHLLYKYIMEMFSKYGSTASVLTPYLDIRKLTFEEAKNFLNCPNLIPSCVNETLVPISIQLIQENHELQQKAEKTDQTLKLIMDRLENLEKKQSDLIVAPTIDESEFTEKIESLMKIIDLGNKRIEDLQNQIADQQKLFKEQLNELEKRAHKDVRKTNKIVNGLTRKTVGYDALFNEIKFEQANLKKGLTDITKKSSRIFNEMMMIKARQRKMKTTNIDFDGRSFNGIMKYLSDEANQNCHLAGEVEITGSTSDHNEPYQIIDMGWNDLFFTENKANQWIMFNFKERNVKVSHYTIKTHKYPNNFPHLKMWAIEGSNDGENWDELDRRAITVLNGANRFQTFPCKKKDGIYRFIRLKQTGTNAKGDFVLALTNFELFGQIYTPEEE